MKRHNLSAEGLVNATFVLLLVLAFVVSTIQLIIWICWSEMAYYTLMPMALLPLIVITLMFNLPDRLAGIEEGMISQDAPRTIGCLSMGMHVKASLEGAFSFAVRMGDGALSRRLREVVWEGLTGPGSVMESILDFGASLSDLNDHVRQSIYLLVSATFESTKAGMDRLMDKANDLVLRGVKENVDRYVSSLSVPTMILFSMGVILPVMLFALLPMLSAAGSFDPASASLGMQPFIRIEMLAPLFILVFPILTFAYSRSVLSKNPLRFSRPLEVHLDRWTLLTLIIWIFAIVSAALLVRVPHITLLAMIIPPSLALIWRLRGSHLTKIRMSRMERDFNNALYQIGNRMLSGAGFERALEQTARSSEGSIFHAYAMRLIHRSRMTRQNLGSLIDSDEEAIPPMMRAALLTVWECARKDPAEAGKVALTLAQNMSDLRNSEMRIEERLSGIMDMMRHTSSFFAPLVLGITSCLLFIVGGQTGQPLGVEGVMLVVGVYLIELCLIVTHFTVSLSGRGDLSEVMYIFASKAPLAVIIYIVSFSLFLKMMPIIA